MKKLGIVVGGSLLILGVVSLIPWVTTTMDRGFIAFDTISIGSFCDSTSRPGLGLF